jgi:hypothetical protein
MVRDGYNPFEPALAGPDSQVYRTPEDDADPRSQRVRAIRGEIAEALGNQNLPGAAALYLRMKAMDPAQVLSRQAQLDVATQLANEQKYDAAVEAYQAYLKT